MKKILLLGASLFLAGCQEQEANYHKVASGQLYDIYCIRGVDYIVTNSRSFNAITPLLKVDGTISICIDEESMIEYMEDMEYHNE